MPYKSDKQRRLFEMCRNNAGSVQGACPPPKVVEKFHQETYHPTAETQSARRAQKKRGMTQYH
jgi:hypothetical protein